MNSDRRRAAPAAGAVLFAGAVFAAGGCWSGPPTMDYSKAGLVQVSGTVRLGGNPLAKAIVIFENPENGTFSFARTDSTGRYTLRFDSVQPGVTKGRKVVRIKTTGSLGEDDRDASAGPERVPACYNAGSKLAVEVMADSDSTNFDLDPNGA